MEKAEYLQRKKEKINDPKLKQSIQKKIDILKDNKTVEK